MSFNNNNNKENKPFPIDYICNPKDKKAAVRKDTNSFNEHELSALTNLEFYANKLSKHTHRAKGGLKRKLDSYSNLIDSFFSRMEGTV